jgi:cytochrome c
MKTQTTISVAVLASGVLWAAPGQENKGDPVQGKAVFAQCSVCHSPDAWRTAGLSTRKGPSLRGLFRKDKLLNGKPVTEANVLSVINDGGKGMSPYKDVLNTQQKADVIAFLKTQ